MFIRRIFYNISGGDIIHLYHMNGNFDYIDAETEKALLLPDMNHEEIGCIEWTEPVEEVESKMMGGYIVTIDVTKEPHEVVFTEAPEPEPVPEGEQEATFDDYMNAFEELGV